MLSFFSTAAPQSVILLRCHSVFVSGSFFVATEIIVLYEAGSLRGLYTKVYDVTAQKQQVARLNLPGEAHKHGRVQRERWTGQLVGQLKMENIVQFANG